MPRSLECFLRRSDTNWISAPRFPEDELRGNDGVVFVVVQSAVAALSERRKSLRIQRRRSETAATVAKVHHHRGFGLFHVERRH